MQRCLRQGDSASSEKARAFGDLAVCSHDLGETGLSETNLGETTTYIKAEVEGEFMVSKVGALGCALSSAFSFFDQCMIWDQNCMKIMIHAVYF